MENEIKNSVTENVNEANNNNNNNNAYKQQSKGTRNPLIRKMSGPGAKLLIIIVMCACFLIPQFIIRNLVNERKSTQKIAQQEAMRSWGEELNIRGPFINIHRYDSLRKENDMMNIYQDIISVVPERTSISGDIKTSQLKRGIYEFTVYDAVLTIEGEFKMNDIDFEKGFVIDNELSTLQIDLNQTHGLRDKAVIDINGEKIPMETRCNYLVCKIDVEKLINDTTAKFSLTLPIKGAERLMFNPIGGNTNVKLTSNCVTPSFTGYYLPDEREVNKKGFTASWSIYTANSIPANCFFGVELKVPVEQYLQTDRAIKYAFLIILLTFAAVFFVEMRKAKPIHPIQYILVGIALTIFYLLLLSFSEHISFLVSYIIASVMTIGLITIFMASVAKDKKTALGIGALLTTIYFFIYILLQLETYALLAGSIGIFIVLAIAMYATQKIEWYKE